MGLMLDVFDERQAATKSALSSTEDLEKVAYILRSFLDDIYDEANSRLQLRQRRITLSCINALKETVNLLAIIDQQIKDCSPQKKYESFNEKQEKIAFPLLITQLFLLAVLLLGFSFDVTPPVYNMVAIIMILALAGLQIFTFSKIESLSVRNYDQKSESFTNYTVSGFQSLKFLRSAIADIDDVLEQIPFELSAVEQKAESIENMKDILSFFQDMLGHLFAEDQNSAYRESKRIQSLLSRYEIDTEIFDVNIHQEQRKNPKFQYRLDEDLKMHQTILPALTRNGKVILQGLVVEPKQKQKT
jgi:hypothetical protein